MKFMEQLPMQPELMACPFCHAKDRIGVHSYKERRCKCHHCDKTFAETIGTPLYYLKYPRWVVGLVLALLAYGCPPAAIVFAFGIDERTVAEWHDKAGQHGKGVQEAEVCNGKVELGQVQADELCVTVQGGKVWMATAMSVFSRLFVWGEVSPTRDRALIERLMTQVRAAGGLVQPVLIAVDGFTAYVRATLKVFSDKYYSGKPGRPPHIPWPDLHIGRVVKRYRGKRVTGISRRVAHGCRDRVDDLIAMSQTTFGSINTAYIERLNATFRARMPALARRTRSLACTVERLETAMFWTGVVYNFCTIHTSLEATPAVAAGLTDHTWSVQELLRFRLPDKSFHDVA
jgi:transposase-like protein